MPEFGQLAGELLRLARRKRGLSQRALAAAAGVSPTVVARIETGKSQPTLTTLGNRPDSDLDLLVEFEPSTPGLRRVDFAEAVEELLGTRVDMINPTTAGARFMRVIRPQLRPLDSC